MQSIGSCMAKILFLEPCSVYRKKEKKKVILTPLVWTTWGAGEVSCIERCPHFRGACILESIFGT